MASAAVEQMVGSFIDLARWLHAHSHDGPYSRCDEGVCPEHRQLYAAVANGPTLADDDTIIDCARWLRLIANDVRSAGDMELVRLGEDGVTQEQITLADELWLVALRLDPERAFDNLPNAEEQQ